MQQRARASTITKPKQHVARTVEGADGRPSIIHGAVQQYGRRSFFLGAWRPLLVLIPTTIGIAKEGRQSVKRSKRGRPAYFMLLLVKGAVRGGQSSGQTAVYQHINTTLRAGGGEGRSVKQSNRRLSAYSFYCSRRGRSGAVSQAVTPPKNTSVSIWVSKGRSVKAVKPRPASIFTLLLV